MNGWKFAAATVNFVVLAAFSYGVLRLFSELFMAMMSCHQ